MSFNKILDSIPSEKRDIVESLLQKNVDSAKFDGQYVMVNFSTIPLRNRVEIVPHYKYSEGWSKDKDLVFVDSENLKYLTPKELLALLIHESIEKFVCQKYDLNKDFEGHIVAKIIEYKWARKNDIDWLSYDLLNDLIKRGE